MSHGLLLASAAMSCYLGSATAYAATRVERKLFQIGGPETRTRCIKNLKTKGLPTCSIKSWKTRCKDTWIVTCSEWATDFKQHAVFLVVEGPDAEQAAKVVLEKAVEHALGAAVGAAEVTPGEVAARFAAAVTAFKIAFLADLAAEPLLASMKDQFHLSFKSSAHW
jgi:hypothetical protein